MRYGFGGKGYDGGEIGILIVESTHPTIATLGHPLFGFAAKRGFKNG
jgi:hypothetical protein